MKNGNGTVAALVIFVDIRGFTGWSDAPEVFARLDQFVSDFLALIRKHFPLPAMVKGLGDGAMIVQEVPEETSAAAHARLLRDTLKTIGKVGAEFTEVCKRFGQAVGHRTDHLRLGWGITRGPVRQLEADYVGSNVNKAARLCDAARPFGVVVDRSDFTADPSTSDFRFHPQTRILTGLQDVDVWVTSEIESKFVAREKIRQLPEVHVAGLVMDTSSRRGRKLLVVTRLPTRDLYPGLIEGGGGQLARSETFEDGLARHYRLEMGIEVKVLTDIHCFYVIREPELPIIPGIRFLCELVGDAEVRTTNYQKAEWVPESEVRNIPSSRFIPGVKDEWMGLLARYRKR